MKILLTNDDGVRAPGLISVAASLKKLGEVVIVAPESQQSAVSHSITLHKPLRCNRLDDFPVGGVRAYATSGTPTDAVLLGIHAVFGCNPDIVISGINGGPNLGADVTYSGTVAGAMEGIVAGVPSIAVSMGAFDNLNYDDCADFTAALAAIVLKGPFPSGVLLNVNYPNIDREKIMGVMVTRLGQRWYEDVVHERVDPRGQKYYWITGRKVLTGRLEGTDAHELEKGYISITPITLDMTSYSHLDDVAGVLTGSPDSGDSLGYQITGPVD